MNNEINDLSTIIAQVLNSPGFDSLNDSDKSLVIKQISSSPQEAESAFGKVFGKKVDSAALYITVLICVIILLIGLIVLLWVQDFSSEYWKGAFPIITGALGYIFGKSNK